MMQVRSEQAGGSRIASSGITRRAFVASGVPAGGVGSALLAACGVQGSGGDAPQASNAPPVEIVWSHWYPPSDPRNKAYTESLRLAERAASVTIKDIFEPGAEYWNKRQAEYAGGHAAVDIMINAHGWILPGGIKGLFVDHAPLLKRDKVDLKQYYQAELESCAWRGKQWALPHAAGGEVVLFNKKIFAEKGVKLPHKDWTYDEFLDMSRRLTDAANNKYAVTIGGNGLHYMMGTFVLNFGGQLLNRERTRALYGDDASAIRGVEFDVDLFLKHKVAPTADALKPLLPPSLQAMEAGVVAMDINGVFRHQTVAPVIGRENLDFAPPPKGPTGKQTAAVAGNSWSIMSLSKAKDAAWKALNWMQSKEGMLGPQLEAMAWPPLINVANVPQWMDRFKGTKIAEAAKAWETGGHDLMPVPEGVDFWTIMNEPINQALKGELGVRDALRESAEKVNQLMAKRPPEAK